MLLSCLCLHTMLLSAHKIDMLAAPFLPLTQLHRHNNSSVHIEAPVLQIHSTRRAGKQAREREKETSTVDLNE